MLLTQIRLLITACLGLISAGVVFADCMRPVTVDTSIAKEIVKSIEQEHINKDLLLYANDSILFDKLISNIDREKTIFSKADIQLINKKCKLRSRDIRKGKFDKIVSIYDFALLSLITETNYAIDKIDMQSLSLEKESKNNSRYQDFASNQQELTSRWDARIAEKYQQQLSLGYAPAQAIETVRKAYLFRQKQLVNYQTHKLLEQAINSFLTIYDDQTKFIPENLMEPTDLNLVGVGLVLKTEGTFPYIAGLIDGSPAHDLLSVNDKILSVSNDGKEFVNLEGMMLEEVVTALRGKKGTEISLTIQPDSGAIKTVRLVREPIRITHNEVSYESLDRKINGINYKFGILKVPSFYMDFDAQLKGDPNYKNSTNDAVKKIISQLESIDGLIVDLRNNQGGAVHEALRFSGLFLDNSKLVELKSVSVPNQIMRSEKNLTLKKKPTMVLINNQTAGAAEWVAAALMDNKYALIAGEHSYGLGTVSSLKELSKGRLQLPIAKVFRMNGKPLKNGVEPDIKTTNLDESTEAFAEFIRESRPL